MIFPCRSKGGEEALNLARQTFMEKKAAGEKENMKALQDARKQSFRKVCRLCFFIIASLDLEVECLQRHNVMPYLSNRYQLSQ